MPNLYTILFRFKAAVFSVGVDHPFISHSTCKAYPIAIQLHAHCAIYAPLTDDPPHIPIYAMHHAILVMAISCKGQW